MRILADEDFDGRIARGLLRRAPAIDLIRVQDVGLSGASDEKLLEWAADNHCIVLTHDNRTMPRHVGAVIVAGLSIPGVIIVDDLAPIGASIDDLLLIIECSEPKEWRDRIFHVPIK